ncbi:PREDICTED: uncharacterized protein LOC108361778 [Rhagoletis zephyria]|uniref:uncharacterized protein LOC108361778 n=1 Tax=Rhagoletis zephyria TaxID=28612 RepID=UPI0008118CFA|nr:PREDICTED: uncharacterized protein LOC108361778 [Rhagoletis zephyria]
MRIYAEANEVPSPFLRSSRIARSPGRDNPLAIEQATNKEPRETQHHKECEYEQTTERGAYGDPLFLLGAKIKEVISRMEGQKHINNQMRDLVKATDEHHKRALTELHGRRPSATFDCKSTQTEREKQAKRNRKSDVIETNGKEPADPNSPRQTNKRSRLTSPEDLIGQTPQQKKSQDQPQNLEQAAINKQTSNSFPIGANATQSGEWKTKMDKRQARSKPGKSDALILKKTGDLAYAEILKEIKSQPELQQLSLSVKHIRKTSKVELLFELKKQADPATQKLKPAVETTLSGKTQVRSITQETLLEIKNIDEVTTRDEVLDALRSNLPNEETMPSAIRSMRAAYGGTQTCTLSLPALTAQTLLDKSKIRIGWVICRVRQKEVVTRCFKCHDFGHVGRQCRNEEDRTNLCFRCGKPDHKARSCSNQPSCILCLKNGQNNTNHATGSRTCPIFQKAKAYTVPAKTP